MESFEVLTRLFEGERVRCKDVQDGLGITFSEGMKLFDYEMNACWWSICGETLEERNRDGLRYLTYFRMKKNVNNI
jgi:hypothetical protein